MCGICGIYGLEAEDCIREMTATLAHRGPDGSGALVSLYCDLGHTRLSIIDLSKNGNQPMANEDGTIWLVVNGEIYNYKSLRSVLVAHGHQFKSQSDSEVILHLYEQQGTDFVKGLRGMFALALYDQKERKLILARDPIGKKPLYYAWHDGSLMFASEIKALFAAGVPKAVNYAMIPTYLMYQYSLGQDTLFKGVRKLPAGHMMTVSKSPTPFLKECKIERYWNLKEGQANGQDLRELLNESVRLRLQSDVPVGAFLSGGIDSSAVCALWRQSVATDIHAFCATFPSHSEAKYAKEVTEHLGFTYHEVEITPAMVARDIEKITWHHDEPLGDAATINTYYLAQEAKKYVKVVLAGEGGDELFGGYSWYRYANRIQMMLDIPLPLRSAGRVLAGVLQNTSLARAGRILNFPCQQTEESMILYPETTMDALTLRWLLRDSGEPARPFSNGIFKDPLNKMLAMDCLNLLPEKFLMKADKGTMAWGIEERLPLLDKHVIEHAFSLPANLKKDKLILRQAVEDLLPPEIVWRPKQGFGTPQAEWLQALGTERLTDSVLLREICFPGWQKNISRLRAGATWSLFALATWYDVWFGGAQCG